MPRPSRRIQLLAGLETDAASRVPLVLAGSPELASRLDRPSLRQIREAVRGSHRLAPLGPGETARYLAHRLEVAGGSFEEVFEPGVEPAFHRFSEGWPQRVSLLADRALAAASRQGLCPISKELVEEQAAVLSTSGATGYPDSAERAA